MDTLELKVPNVANMNYCYKAEEYDEPPADEECKNYIASYFKQQAKEK